MILVNKKIFKEIWWMNLEDKNVSYSVVRYCQCNVNLKKVNRARVSQTLITDLSLNQDELLMSFNSTVRNAIRRIERDGAEIKIYNSAELKENKEIIKQFIKTFNINYKTLGLKYKLKKMPINAYIHSNAFYLSVVYYQNQPIIFHSYLANEKKCQLLHSASYCRSEKQVKFEISRNEIGMYNRYLHWKDMLFFKEKGVDTYNWGGISSCENPNGIDKFKMQFNGQFATNPYFLVANNWFGSLILKLFSNL